MKIINLTPHDITLFREDGSGVCYAASGQVARATESACPVGEIDGFPIVEMYYAGISGLPEPCDDTMYIVSGFVAQAALERDDLVCPDTGPDSVVRDDKGRIVGVRRWCVF